MLNLEIVLISLVVAVIVYFILSAGYAVYERYKNPATDEKKELLITNPI